MLATTVTSVSGSVPIIILAPALALGFTARFFGNSIALARNQWGMPWGGRITSWLAFGLAAYLMWTAGSLFAIAAFTAFIVLDAAAGFVRREVEEKDRKPLDLRPLWIGTGITIYLGLTAAFWFLAGRYFVYGVLTTWTILAFGFALLLRLTMVGPKAGENWLRAPMDHRRHERREQPVRDEQRERANEVARAFLSTGDPAALLDTLRDAARAADVSESDLRALEARVLQVIGRGDDKRKERFAAAIKEAESFLALRGTPIPIKKETFP